MLTIALAAVRIPPGMQQLAADQTFDDFSHECQVGYRSVVRPAYTGLVGARLL